MDSLCSKKSCPYICVRVCHCPAGLARSHQLLGMYRNRREFTREKGGTPAPLTPEYQAQIEFLPQVNHSSKALNQPQHGRPPQLYPTHNYRQAAIPYTRQIKLYASTTFLIGLLAFITIVVLVGITLNHGNFAPGYEPPKIFHQEWQ